MKRISHLTWALCALAVLAFPMLYGCGGGGSDTQANTLPTAAFTMTPDTGTTATAFQFDATGCTGKAGLQVRWDWTNDGAFDTDFSATMTATHTFATVGEYTVKLEVKDVDGKLSSTTKSVTVTAVPAANTAPVAKYNVWPGVGTINTVFQFNAGACTDKEDAVDALQVRWDFNGDGVWDTEYSATKTTSHQYDATGSYNVKMMVKDTGGLTAICSGTITVGSNEQPKPSFTAAPDQGNLDTTFQFDASGSSDAEDPTSALQVRWDWNNDGVYETEYTTTKTAEYKFPASTTLGDQTIRLQVLDTGGLTSTTTRTIKLVSGANTAPHAAFVVYPNVTVPNSPVTVDASSCADQEDPITALQVRWDWENDGVWDTDFSTTKVATHKFDTTGVKVIHCQVKDTKGLTGEFTQQVVILSTN